MLLNYDDIIYLQKAFPNAMEIYFAFMESRNLHWCDDFTDDNFANMLFYLEMKSYFHLFDFDKSVTYSTFLHIIEDNIAKYYWYKYKFREDSGTII